MKRSLSLLCSLLTAALTQAQVDVYVCEGYDYEKISVESYTEVQFSSDQSSVTIGDETFDVSDVDSILFHEPQYDAITVTWSGSSASVSIPSSISGVTYSTSGAYVTLTSTNTTDELLYVLSGTSSKGGIQINGSYKMRIHLDGVSLTSLKGSPFDIECGKRIEVKLMKGTENSFVDASTSSVKGAFYTKGHLEIKGKGTLNVTGNYKHAICAGEYLQLKPSTGTINILSAASDGIHCGDGEQNSEHSYFIMDGGTLNIASVGSDAIDADDYGSIIINDGSLSLSLSQTDGCGLKADSCIYLNGGDISLNVTGDINQAIRYNYNGYFDGGTISGTISGDGSKGFKAKSTTSSSTVNNGGNAYFRGTDVSLTVSGGTYTADSSKCIGIRIDNDLYQTDGDIVLTVTNSAAEGIDVKGTTYRTGGTLTEQ